MPPSSWYLCALGPARLSSTDGTVLELERKTAGLLAFLALEGSVMRSRMAGYLWPESREHTARNNLTQLLRKLRLAAGEDLVLSSAGGNLRLQDRLCSDLSEARELHFLGRHEEFLNRTGTLLGELDYDDCPEFEQWLSSERDRWLDWRRTSLIVLADAAEQQGSLSLALGYAERLLAAEPASEEAFARLIRTQYLLGDRHRALETYRRLEEVLQQEFGVAPLPSTRELVGTIQRGQIIARAAQRPRSRIPLSVLKPPVLAGREREWELMEAAWEQGQGIILCGEPGVGKSRLMLEFAASKGRYLQFDGRPGDQVVPYATFARCWRRALHAHPQLEIPEWVRREFSRLVPEVWPGEPPPLLSPTDKIRFFDATAEMARLISQHAELMLGDDMQYYDPASNELSAHIASTFAPFTRKADAALPIVAYRRGDIPPELDALIRTLVDAGLHVRIDLAPLDTASVKTLLIGLDLPGASQHAQRLASFSGGNPLYLLETVKHLYETDQLEGAHLDVLPVPEKVGSLMHERFMRLTPTARHAAQAAAVLQSDFSVELLAEVLNAPLLDVVAAWQELERAQIITGERFSHDLVYESLLRSMPDSTSHALHRSAARTLEKHTENPARIARHWLRGQDAMRAVPKLLEAARQAGNALRFTEAAEHLEQASVTLETHGDLEAAFDMALVLVREVLACTALPDWNEKILARLAALARSPAQHAELTGAAALLGVSSGQSAFADSQTPPP